MFQVVGCVGSVVVLACGALAQKSPDVRIDTDPAGTSLSAEPSIATSGTTVHVVWEDWRDGETDVYYSRSTDGGATWLAAEVRLDTDPPGQAHSRNPVVVASGTAVYVAWEEWRSGKTDVYFNRSLDGGVTWLAADVRLNRGPAGFTVAVEPTIRADGTSVYVTWQDDRLGANDVFFDRSLDGGTTWLGQQVRVNTNAGPGKTSRSHMAVDDGAVYVVWWDLRHTVGIDGDIYFNRSLDDGTSWLANDVRIDRDPTGLAWSFNPRVAARGDTVHVVWLDRRDGQPDVYYTRSADAGSTWPAADVRLDTDAAGAAESTHARMVASGSSVYVAWTDKRDGGSDVYFNGSADEGVSWLPADVRLDTDPPGSAASLECELAADREAVFVTWWETRDTGLSGSNIQFNRSLDGGRTWLAQDRRVDSDPTSPGQSREQHVALSAHCANVVWYDNRNGTGDIYTTILFGFQPYGSTTAAAGCSQPRLVGNGRPVLTHPFSVDVVGGVPNAPAAMMLGAPAALPLFGGTLYVNPVLLLPLALGPAGTVSVPLLVDDPGLLGATIAFQVAVSDACFPSSVVLTNGLDLWIG